MKVETFTFIKCAAVVAFVSTLMAINHVSANVDDVEITQAAPIKEELHDIPNRKTADILPFAKIKFFNGNIIHFYELPDGHGESEFGFLEEGQAGNPSILKLSDLSELNALEVFHALSAPGTKIPNQLTSRFGEVMMGEQGRLRKRMQTTDTMQATVTATTQQNMCDANTFQNKFSTFTSPIWDGKLVRTNERPIDHPERWVGYREYFGNWGDGFPAYKYRAKRYDVELYYTMVAVCGLDTHPTYCTRDGHCRNHPGPEIIFSYVTPSNNYGTVLITDVPSNGVGNYYSWFFYTGVNWDWSTKIELARAKDKFNIGLAWKD